MRPARRGAACPPIAACRWLPGVQAEDPERRFKPDDCLYFRNAAGRVRAMDDVNLDTGYEPMNLVGAVRESPINRPLPAARRGLPPGLHRAPRISPARPEPRRW